MISANRFKKRFIGLFNQGIQRALVNQCLNKIVKIVLNVTKTRILSHLLVEKT